MKHLAQPCNECPFTKSSLGGWLGSVYNSAQELHSLVMNELPFPCHKAQEDKVVTFDRCGTDENPLCAGALLYMKKNAKSPRNFELNKAMQNISKDKIDIILSTPEFFDHHKHII